MTRIIAGFAGSLSLEVPGTGTRPTSDRVREAIFSALESRDVLAGAHVADLFAGSGALGLEALSRGAASVVLVDRARAAAAVCRRNVARVTAAIPKGHTVPRADVVAQGVPTFLEGSAAIWDLVFLDPPYDFAEAELADVLKALVPRLAPDAVVLIERDSRSPEPAWSAGLALERSKRYGDTTLWWARLSVDED
ncbi:MAG: 16S rRNA (guanine(966)-N(2))-methyltransferase RsmD [Cryobacterium sp.]|nr:16S rRNA (guanine(966)-N(2))-methyltransferase RsmD [Cryobacterium sp.]